MNRIGALLALIGGATLLWSGYGSWRVRREAAALSAATTAVHALVDAGLDARGPDFDVAQNQAATAMLLWPTADAVGASTLVEVWRLGVLGVQRDPRRFDETIAQTPESLPARAAWELASLASCRAADERGCPEAEAAFTLLWDDLLGTRWDGLRAPLLHAWLGLWVERGYRTGSADAWNQVRTGCIANPEQLDEASPDDVLGLCLAAAGALADYERWFVWAHRARRNEVLAPWGLDEARLHRVFTTPSPGCRNLGLRMSARWGTLVPDVVTAEHGFCYAAGMLALGCQFEAAEVIASGRQVYPGAPWAQITRSYTPSRERCYLGGD